MDWIVGPRYVYVAPPLVKSKPFIVISTATEPTVCAGDMHSIKLLEVRMARVSPSEPNRQNSVPADAARSQNGPPLTCTNVPPPTGPCAGRSTSMTGLPRYSNRIPLLLKSWLLMLTSTVTLPEAMRARERHSMSDSDTQRAATGVVAPSPNRQTRSAPTSTNPLP